MMAAMGNKETTYASTIVEWDNLLTFLCLITNNTISGVLCVSQPSWII